MKKRVQNFILPGFLSILFMILVIILFQVVFEDKFLPRVYIGETHLVMLTKPQAATLLQAKFRQRTSQILPFEYQGQNFSLDLATSSAALNISPTLEQAFALGHQQNILQKLLTQAQVLLLGATIEPQVSFNLNSQLQKIAQAVQKSPKDASISISEKEATPSTQVDILEGQNGLELDQETLLQQIKDYLVFGKKQLSLPIKVVEPNFTTYEAKAAKIYLDEISKNPIVLTFQEKSWTIDVKALVPLLSFSQKDSIIDQEKLKNYLKTVEREIDQEVVEALFNFNPSSGRVAAFKPSQEGRKLDANKTAVLIMLALEGKRAKVISLTVEITQPKIATAGANNLGIKELIGQGISHFAGSIANRVYNIQLAASRINGVLIPPAGVFSFNDRVGDISAESGYRQAYVIKEGRTVLDDGGGVCQDSTTLFRAVLNAGLPVLARTAHAYRVAYYEQGFPPGLDATVFAPSVDFKFKNDTQNHILIQAYTQGVTLYVDLYGSKDGRVSKLTTPVVTNQTPPPPELRQDDPELQRGVVKQVDWAAWGADVSFKRVVTKGGEVIINETWGSKFKPWQAIYLVGTKE